jgi:hypothetical protein
MRPEVVHAYLLGHLPSEKACQDEAQLGGQVVERGLDLPLNQSHGGISMGRAPDHAGFIVASV